MKGFKRNRNEILIDAGKFNAIADGTRGKTHFRWLKVDVGGIISTSTNVCHNTLEWVRSKEWLQKEEIEEIVSDGVRADRESNRKSKLYRLSCRIRTGTYRLWSRKRFIDSTPFEHRGLNDLDDHTERRGHLYFLPGRENAGFYVFED